MSLPEAIVNTAPQQNLNGFIQQRVRWAGKWRHNNNKSSKLAAVLIFLFHVSMLSLLPALLFGWVNVEFILVLCGGKAFFEFWFLKNVSAFLGYRWNWTAFILWQFLYPFYAIYIGSVSHFQSFSWKGRRLKSIKTKLDTIADID
jgi:hypothetical protein